ncbi:MAG TPA: adenylate/guanylate cyclase domain-containing protein, partial [Gemmataceae bacterium]|nr:adenylate/guanylate cyclase domain-containing protein [Gemmataceae bacterium]
ILDHQGVLVDYAGDEVMAMWGAPAEQPDHARLACRAARAMVDRLADLNAHWQGVLGGPMAFGIGINTGEARVGNVGSHRKFKYGLHGTTANLASRVQGATKYLRAGILVTAATRAALGDEFALRRLCRIGVVNIEQPVELYELRPQPGPGWPALRDGYEKALTAFEEGDFRQAAGLLGNLLVDHPDDGPSLVLLSRAVQAVMEAGGEGGAVWRLPGK